MQLKNCVKCGRMFSAEEGQKFCSNCYENDDEIFRLVREYIYDNPGSSVEDVAIATEVDEDKILKFLRQGKLALKGDGVGLECERCGKTISSGRYCDACSAEMKKGFNQAFGVDKKQVPAPAPVKKKAPESRGMFIKK